MKLAVRAQYPEDPQNANHVWMEYIKPFKDLCSIEVAFYRPEPFFENPLTELIVVEPVKFLGIDVCSVHMPHIGLADIGSFEDALEKTLHIADKLECQTLVVHPEREQVKPADFSKLYDPESLINSRLDLYDNDLCWETFEGKTRTFKGLENMFDFCRKTNGKHKICYDFSHVHLNQEDTLKLIDANLDLIKVFHVSNRSNIYSKNKVHLPIRHEGGDLDFQEILSFLKQKDYSGNLVLEYLEEYHEKMPEDIAKIREYLE